MGISFIPMNGKDLLDLSSWIWVDLLDIALENGWEPMGTVEPYGEADIEWDGHYCSSDFQLVLEEDLLAIADALEKAIAGREDNTVCWIKDWIDQFRESGGIMLG
jgi:hypothetical protein